MRHKAHTAPITGTSRNIWFYSIYSLFPAPISYIFGRIVYLEGPAVACNSAFACVIGVLQHFYFTNSISKLQSDDDWSTYSDNGWSFSYRHVSQNFIYLRAQKTSQGNNPAISGSLVAAGLPFKAAFTQLIPCHMEVTGVPVGYGRARIETNNGMYLCASAYANDVSYIVYGFIVVE